MNWIELSPSWRLSHPLNFGVVAFDKPLRHHTHVSFGDHLGAGTFGHLRRSFGIAKQFHDMSRKGQRVVGKSADLAIFVSESFSPESRRDNWNPRRKGLQ